MNNLYKHTCDCVKQDQLSAILTAFQIVKNIRKTRTSRFLPNLIKVHSFQTEILEQKEKYEHFLSLLHDHTSRKPHYALAHICQSICQSVYLSVLSVCCACNIILTQEMHYICTMHYAL